MESAAVIPNSNIINVPAIANLKVMVFGNMPEEEIEHGVRFVGLQFNDAFGEAMKELRGYFKKSEVKCTFY